MYRGLWISLFGFCLFFSYKSHSPGAGKLEDAEEGAGRYVPNLLASLPRLDAPLGFIGSNSEKCVVYSLRDNPFTK